MFESVPIDMFERSILCSYAPIISYFSICKRSSLEIDVFVSTNRFYSDAYLDLSNISVRNSHPGIDLY